MKKETVGDASASLDEVLVQSPLVESPLAEKKAVSTAYERYMQGLELMKQLREAAKAEQTEGMEKEARYVIELDWKNRELSKGGDTFTKVRFEYVEASGRCYIPTCPFSARAALSLPPYPHALSPDQLSKMKEKVQQHWETANEREAEYDLAYKRVHFNFKMKRLEFLPPMNSEFRRKAWIMDEEIPNGEWYRREKEMKEQFKESVSNHFFAGGQ